MITSIPEISDLLIQKGVPFAIYCLPASEKFKLVFQKDYSVKQINILDIENVSGFIVASFSSAMTGMVNLIEPDVLLSDGDIIGKELEFINSLPNKQNYHFTNNYIISKSDYLERATYLINKLEKGDLQKVVLSRVIQKELNRTLKTGELLKKLKEKYNSAFVYLFHLPEEGTWCGASPEPLFKVVDGSVITDALAGTKLAEENNMAPSVREGQIENPGWTVKEKEEQYFVTLFIESLLSELSIDNYEEFGPITINAGNLLHLQTEFKIPLSEIESKTGRFIAGMHPTPAVCGLPKAEAYLLIQKAEQHQRRYYTGFLGPWNLNNTDIKPRESQLFVNLRCAELGKDIINLYVGGGLTSSSNPKSEYEETVHKSQTLLSVVENL